MTPESARSQATGYLIEDHIVITAVEFGHIDAIARCRHLVATAT